MKLKSISGIILHTLSISLTKEFYESLGFRVDEATPDSLTCYVSSFWIEFQYQPSLTLITSTTQSLAINVSNVETFYTGVLEHGYHPETVPVKVNDRREFTLRDPNGHLLTFFEK